MTTQGYEYLADFVSCRFSRASYPSDARWARYFESESKLWSGFSEMSVTEKNARIAQLLCLEWISKYNVDKPEERLEEALEYIKYGLKLFGLAGGEELSDDGLIRRQ